MRDLTHDVDLGHFAPLTIEQTYWLVRFIADHPDRDTGHRHLASGDEPPSFDELAGYINVRCPNDPVAPSALIAPWRATSVLESSPVAKYSFWCQLFPDAWFTFMNYGFYDAGRPWPSDRLTAAEHLWSHAVRLYDEVVPADVELRGRDVIEVGSGRGGGAAYLARTRGPRRYLGIDRTRSNVLFARAVHEADNLAFAPGLATDLPLHDGCCDVIVNVESAPYYHPIEAFADGAARVLRPGGQVCLATYGPAEEVRRLRDAFIASGFSVEASVDITANVRQALALQDRGIAVLARVETARSRTLYERELASIYDPGHLDGAVYLRFVFKKDVP